MTKVLTASKKLDEICSTALHKWGVQAQIEMMVEESGELLQALMHYRRRRSSLEDVHGEIADVLIMCWQMRLIFGSEGVDAKLQEKLDRIEKRQFSKRDE